MTVVADLYALQEIDLALDRALARLEAIEEGVKESEELLAARAEKEEKEAALAALRRQQQEAEWAVDEVRTKAAEVETKLYSGRVTNAKELADLDADLRSLRNTASRREDVLLGVMEQVEQAEAEVRAAADRYQEIESEWARNREELLREKQELEPEVARLRKEREGRAAGIDRAALNLYELLRSRRGGQAVARVERGMCQGCRITLPTTVLTRARSGAGLVQCVSCERILLVD
jgi:predicted  nucleic acid-binding Zn-ribbon protein